MNLPGNWGNDDNPCAGRARSGVLEAALRSLAFHPFQLFGGPLPTLYFCFTRAYSSNPPVSVSNFIRRFNRPFSKSSHPFSREKHLDHLPRVISCAVDDF